MDEENISNFAGITGSSTDVARGFLQIAGGDMERAVALYFENPELVSGMSAGLAGASTSTSSRPAQTASSRTRANLPREDSSGVIHISDDDDDDDMNDYNYEDDGDDGHEAALLAANTAQEEEDAAMAKRLQEELYQQGGAQGAEADVRAPIARTTETLVAPESAWGPNDDEAILENIRRRRNNPRKDSFTLCGEL